MSSIPPTNPHFQNPPIPPTQSIHDILSDPSHQIPLALNLYGGQTPKGLYKRIRNGVLKNLSKSIVLEYYETKTPYYDDDDEESDGGDFIDWENEELGGDDEDDMNGLFEEVGEDETGTPTFGEMIDEDLQEAIRIGARQPSLSASEEKHDEARVGRASANKNTTTSTTQPHANADEHPDDPQDDDENPLNIDAQWTHTGQTFTSNMFHHCGLCSWEENLFPISQGSGPVDSRLHQKHSYTCYRCGSFRPRFQGIVSHCVICSKINAETRNNKKVCKLHSSSYKLLVGSTKVENLDQPPIIFTPEYYLLNSVLYLATVFLYEPLLGNSLNKSALEETKMRLKQFDPTIASVLPEYSEGPPIYESMDSVGDEAEKLFEYAEQQLKALKKTVKLQVDFQLKALEAAEQRGVDLLLEAAIQERKKQEVNAFLREERKKMHEAMHGPSTSPKRTRKRKSSSKKGPPKKKKKTNGTKK